LRDTSLVKFQGLIDGKWVDAKSGERISVFSASDSHIYLNHLFTLHLVDPATDDELGTVPEMGLEETKEAIEAASRAFVSWSRTTAKVCRSLSPTLTCG
jgi:succinate-semialdehyde dehydrogenase/glutarate-semialdehyde dehydrogenase